MVYYIRHFLIPEPAGFGLLSSVLRMPGLGLPAPGKLTGVAQLRPGWQPNLGDGPVTESAHAHTYYSS